MHMRMRTVGLLFCLIDLLAMLTFGVSGLVFISYKTKATLRPLPSVSIGHRPGSSAVAVLPTTRPVLRSTRESIANPVRLVIPMIGVDAAIESLGILANGNLATPVQHPWDDAGWYDLGPRPGTPGSAVIDGHLDRPGGYPAVFWRLRNLQIGDKVRVIDAQGKTLSFHVINVTFYPVQELPVQEIFGNNQGFYLNLITCAGDWIPDQHQTNQRLVVYTAMD